MESNGERMAKMAMETPVIMESRITARTSIRWL